jgi:O-antigen/teichoic acid export membrane protein
LSKFKKIFFGKLARASSWLLAGGVFGGILGYFFQIIMGRLLSVSEYGIFVSLTAILALFGALLNTLSMVVSRQVSSYRADKHKGHRTLIFYNSNQKILILAIIFASILFFTAENLQNFLHIEKEIHILLLFAILFVAFPQSVNNAFLQGMQYFKWLSLSGVLSTFIKIIISVALIYAGFGVSGALGGLLISSIIMLIMTFFIIRPTLGVRGINVAKKTRYISKQVLPVLLANIAFVIMTQIDMIMVKHFFSAQDAGIYAAASILGKAVMYLPGGISLALFPMVAEKHADGEISMDLFLQAVLITVVLCTIGSVLYYYFSDLIIFLLYGKDYQSAALILKYFGFAMFPMALIMVAEHFLIAMGRVVFAYLFMILVPLQIVAFYFYHETLLNIVYIMIISGILLFLIGYGLMWRIYKNEQKAS